MNREKLLRSYEHDIADLKQKLASEKEARLKAEAACAELRSALLRFRHVDGCFCEVSFDNHPGAHPSHWIECDAAQHALSTDCGKGILKKLKVATEALRPFAACNPHRFKSIPPEASWLWKPNETHADPAGISIAHIDTAKQALAALK